MNSPSRLSNLSKQTIASNASHNVERISALAEKLNQIQVIYRIKKYTKIFGY